MNYTAFIFGFLLLLPASASHASDEEFTVLVEHYETAQPATSETFRGRQWDLRNVLASSRFPTSVEWLSAANEKGDSFRGATYCVRVKAPATGPGRGPAIAPEQRVQSTLNLVTQLKLRQSEMREAGAEYRVEYPSRCGSNRTLARLAR
jgi:hypothetical protein